MQSRCRFLPVSMCVLVLAVSTPARAFIRGDADNNGSREITDAILVLNFLFTGGRAPVCAPAADSNGDKLVNISDPVNLLGHLFLGNPAPPPLTEAEENECKGIDPAAIARGMKEYEEPDDLGNLFSCALCHSMSPDAESDIVRAGHTLLNAIGRPSYKQGGAASFLAAVNVCRTDWMVTDPWAESEPRFKDLFAFMESVSTEETSPALEYEIVAPARDGLPPETASAEEGCKLFNRSCAVCHMEGGVGSTLAPSLVDTFVEDLDDPNYLRIRIRLSGPNHPGTVYQVPEGFELIGTVMPFWTSDKLSDAGVEDLVSFIAEAREAIRAGGSFTCSDPPDPGGNVLRRGTLVRKFHGVGGIAEELDTRKIRLSEFNYDGGGISVKVYLYKTGDIRNGKAIGPDLFRPGNPYVNQTIVMDIPAEISSDSFDSVSIWCVSAKQDFGSALLEPVP